VWSLRRDDQFGDGLVAPSLESDTVPVLVLRD
jgi:hypothetical protein